MFFKSASSDYDRVQLLPPHSESDTRLSEARLRGEVQERMPYPESNPKLMQHEGFLPINSAREDPISGIFWDEVDPSSEAERQSIRQKRLYFLPLILRTRRAKVWNDEIGLLADVASRSNTGGDFRRPRARDVYRYFLTDPRLFCSREMQLEAGRKFGLVAGWYRVCGLLLEPLSGGKGQYKRVGLVVCWGAGDNRNAAKVILNALNRAVLGGNEILDTSAEDKKVYLIEIF